LTERVSAIVLAGGRSSRFGRDKLAEPIRGRPLLIHAIEGVRPFASEVLVVVAPGSRSAAPPAVIVVVDASPFEGPLAGLLAGLRAASGPTVIVTAGDMPELMPKVVQSLLDSLHAAGQQAAVLEHQGKARPLPMAVRRIPALDAARRLIAGGERRLGALTDALATTVIAEATWRALDPDGATMRDIDSPADLR
jgi:molybdopterin-guanine dinucleotide biosynthesis protein A